MDGELSAELRTFVAHERGVRAERLGVADSLFHDLGTDGADGWEFMEHFGQRFAVDVSEFDFDSHFGAEAAGNPFLWLYWWLRPSRRPAVIPITLADLEEARRTGRWVTPARPPRPVF